MASALTGPSHLVLRFTWRLGSLQQGLTHLGPHAGQLLVNAGSWRRAGRYPAQTGLSRSPATQVENSDI